jgi:hypothetical protein
MTSRKKAISCLFIGISKLPWINSFRS